MHFKLLFVYGFGKGLAAFEEVPAWWEEPEKGRTWLRETWCPPTGTWHA